MKETLRVYAVHLTTNLYSDRKEICYSEGYRLVEHPYRPEITKDPACLRLVTEHAAKEGYNAILLQVGDALIYDTHPEIALPGAWTKAELKAELEAIRALGMEVIPMLNFSAAHDVWMGEYAYAVSTPGYYKLCEDLIGELCELFGSPRFFHLGMDGENSKDQENLDYAVVRGNKLFSHDLRFLIACCKAHGATPWLFADFAGEYPKDFLEAVPKDALLSANQVNFRYHHPSDHAPTEQALLDAMKLGYERIVPSLTCFENDRVPGVQMDLMKEHAPKEQIVGYLSNPYLLCESKNRFKLIYDLLHAKKAFDAYRADIQ